MFVALLASLGGALTIVSPCILPVLPFVFARTEQPFVKSTLPLPVGMALTFAAIATLAAIGGGWLQDFYVRRGHSCTVVRKTAMGIAFSLGAIGVMGCALAGGDSYLPWLMVAGALLMWLGQIMNLWLPINKNLWTSSYSVFMAGLAMIFRNRENNETVLTDMLVLITLWMIIDSPHFPWYFTWLAFAAAIKPRPSYILLTGLAFIDYVGWVEQEHPGIQVFVNDFKFVIFYTVLVAENLWASRLGKDLKQWLQAKTGLQLLPSET